MDPMPENFREKMGYVLAVLVLILVFTGMGLIIVPGLAPLLVLFLFLGLWPSRNRIWSFSNRGIEGTVG